MHYKIIVLLFTWFIISYNCRGLFAQDITGQKKDTLLWYTGKKTAANTLITDNGMKVTFDPATGKVTTSFPSGKDPMQTIIDKMNNEEKDEEQLMQIAKSGEDGIKMYPVIKEAIRYYENLRSEMKESMAGKMINVNNEPASDEQKLAELQKNFCSFYRKDYDLIIQYAKICKTQKNFNIPVPPTADYFNCWACDTVRQNNYQKKVDEYVSAFYAEESGYIKKAFEIIRNSTLLAASGTCNYLSTSYLNNAVDEIVLYVLSKASELWKRYHKDHQKLQPLVKTVLNVYRTAILIGTIGNNGEDDIMHEMASEVGLFASELNLKLTHDQDYTMLPMIPFIIGTYRQAILMGAVDNSDKIITDILKATHFRLTIDLYTRVGKSQAHQVMSYHTDGHVIGAYDSTRCLRWLPAGAKGDKNMWLYTQLRQAEVISPAHYTYVGPHDFYLDFDLRTHLCNKDANSDTLYIQTTLIPEGKQLIYWNLNGHPSGAPFESFSGFKLFVDPKNSGMDMIAKYNSGELKLDSKEMIANAEKAKAMAIQMKQGGLSQTDITNKLSGAFTSVSNTNSLFDRFTNQTAAFPVTIYKKKVLIDQEFNAKDFNPLAASQGIIEVGTIKIHLEHIDEN